MTHDVAPMTIAGGNTAKIIRKIKDANASDVADAKQKFEQESIFPIGATNDAYAQYFIGQGYLIPISTE